MREHTDRDEPEGSNGAVKAQNRFAWLVYRTTFGVDCGLGRCNAAWASLQPRRGSRAAPRESLNVHVNPLPDANSFTIGMFDMIRMAEKRGFQGRSRRSRVASKGSRPAAQVAPISCES